MKVTKLSLFLFLSLPFVFTFYITLKTSKKEISSIKINFSKCSFLISKPKAVYYRNNHTLQIFINKNCCNTYLNVKTCDDTVYIKEIRNGTICRCFCTVAINIFSNKQWKDIYFEDFTGKKIKIEVTYK